MKKDNLQVLLIGLKLCLICAVAAVGLGAVNEVTEPVIVDRKAQQELLALKELVPDGVSDGAADSSLGERVPVVSDDAVRAYFPLTRQGVPYAYILDLNGLGYGGDMKVLAAYQADGQILDIRLLDNLETPGLGKKAEDPSYMDKFRGTGGSGNAVPVTKEMLQGSQGVGAQQERGIETFGEWFLGARHEAAADSVTGATITFTGISRALAQGERFVREEVGR